VNISGDLCLKLWQFFFGDANRFLKTKPRYFLFIISPILILFTPLKTLCHYGFKAANAKGWMSEVAQEFSFCFNNFSY